MRVRWWRQKQKPLERENQRKKKTHTKLKWSFSHFKYRIFLKAVIYTVACITWWYWTVLSIENWVLKMYVLFLLFFILIVYGNQIRGNFNFSSSRHCSLVTLTINARFKLRLLYTTQTIWRCTIYIFMYFIHSYLILGVCYFLLILQLYWPVSEMLDVIVFYRRKLIDHIGLSIDLSSTLFSMMSKCTSCIASYHK